MGRRGESKGHSAECKVVVGRVEGNTGVESQSRLSVIEKAPDCKGAD